jgi:hypothetical protein
MIGNSESQGLGLLYLEIMKQFPLIYYIAVGIELEMLSKRQECKVYLAEVL